MRPGPAPPGGAGVGVWQVPALVFCGPVGPQMAPVSPEGFVVCENWGPQGRLGCTWSSGFTGLREALALFFECKSGSLNSHRRLFRSPNPLITAWRSPVQPQVWAVSFRVCLIESDGCRIRTADIN